MAGGRVGGRRWAVAEGARWCCVLTLVILGSDEKAAVAAGAATVRVGAAAAALVKLRAIMAWQPLSIGLKISSCQGGRVEPVADKFKRR